MGAFLADAVAKYGIGAINKIMQIMKNLQAGSHALKGVKWKEQFGSTGANLPTFASGYIPNFEGGGLGAAIHREKSAGIPSSAIRINSSPQLRTTGNPTGLAVTNTFDEPRGLNDVGLGAGGYIPNFAKVEKSDILGRAKWTIDPTAGTEFRADLNKEMKLAANEYANNRMSTRELTDKIKSLTTGIGGAKEGTNAFIKEQKRLLRSTKAYAKTLKPGGIGMGGMMAMMAVPMIGGQIEQAVGGRTGAAVSGGLTGGVMGGMLGGMAAGAAWGTAGGPWGWAAGAIVGAGMGIATSLSATAEKADQVNAALQALKGGIEANAKGAAAYVTAQQELTEASTLDSLNEATLKAANALNAIGDVNLRDELAATGESVEGMREVIDNFVTNQKREMLLLAAKGAMMGMQENKVLGKQMKDIREGGDESKIMDPRGLYQRGGRQAFGGLRDIFMAEDVGLDKVKEFVKNMREQQETVRPWLGFSGTYTDEDIYGHLQKAFEGKDVTEKFLLDFAAAIESGLDPDMWAGKAEVETQAFFNKFFVPMYAEKLKQMGAKTKALGKRRDVAVNYTRDLESFLRKINETVTEYTANLAQITEETAMRQAIKGARAGFLGFRGGGAALRETRGVGAMDIAARRRTMDEGLFKEHATAIMGQIEKVAKNVEQLTDFRQKVVFGAGGFVQGGFQAGIEQLRERMPTTGADIKAYEKLISTLQIAFNEQKAVIDKDEKVQNIKLKGLELRAHIVEEEHRLNIAQARLIGEQKLAIGRETGELDLFKASQERTIEAPGAMNFLTSAQRLQKTQGVDTAIFERERQFRQKESLSQAKQQLTEIQAQAKLNALTSKLVESNLNLNIAIDNLTKAITSESPTGDVKYPIKTYGPGTRVGGGGEPYRLRAGGGWTPPAVLPPTSAAGPHLTGPRVVATQGGEVLKGDFGNRPSDEAHEIARQASQVSRRRRGATPLSVGELSIKVDPQFKLDPATFFGSDEAYQTQLKEFKKKEQEQERIKKGKEAPAWFKPEFEAEQQKLETLKKAARRQNPSDRRRRGTVADETAYIAQLEKVNQMKKDMSLLPAADPFIGSAYLKKVMGPKFGGGAQGRKELEDKIRDLGHLITRDAGVSTEQMAEKEKQQEHLKRLKRELALYGGEMGTPVKITPTEPLSSELQQMLRFTTPEQQLQSFLKGAGAPSIFGAPVSDEGFGGASRDRFGIKTAGESPFDLTGFSKEQLQDLLVINDEIEKSIIGQDKASATALDKHRQQFVVDQKLNNLADEYNQTLKDQRQEWERIDNIRSKDFWKGLEDGFSRVQSEEEGIFNRLGNELPMQFKNNMVGAMEATLDKTTDLGDALEGVAVEFLRSMRRAFLDSAVSNMMMAGKAIWSGATAQRGGIITAQGGRLVPGTGSGDKVPLLAEPGEIVMNREAVNAVGADTLLGINSAIPRFQKGGGHLMTLGKKLPRDWSQMSGLFLQRGNAETEELAEKHVEAMEKKAAAAQKKRERKAALISMFTSALLSGAMSWGAGKIGKWAKGRSAKQFAKQTSGGASWKEIVSHYGSEQEAKWAFSGGDQRGGLVRRQSGGFVGRSGSVARRYGSYQGGGTVSVPSGAPALGSSTNTNNVSINISLGGGDNSRGSGASQTTIGNTGGPSKVSDGDAKALADKIKGQVLKVIAEEQRVSGSLWQGARRP